VVGKKSHKHVNITFGSFFTPPFLPSPLDLRSASWDFFDACSMRPATAPVREASSSSAPQGWARWAALCSVGEDGGSVGYMIQATTTRTRDAPMMGMCSSSASTFLVRGLLGETSSTCCAGCPRRPVRGTILRSNAGTAPVGIFGVRCRREGLGGYVRPLWIPLLVCGEYIPWLEFAFQGYMCFLSRVDLVPLSLRSDIRRTREAVCCRRDFLA